VDLSTTIIELPGDYPIRVLLVDDHTIVAEAVRRALASEPNIEFRFCSNAADAVRTAEEFEPTVILQDLVMPGVEGLDLVRSYRERAATRSVPIVVLSTKEDPVVKSDAFAMARATISSSCPMRSSWSPACGITPGPISTKCSVTTRTVRCAKASASCSRSISSCNG